MGPPSGGWQFKDGCRGRTCSSGCLTSFRCQNVAHTRATSGDQSMTPSVPQGRCMILGIISHPLSVVSLKGANLSLAEEAMRLVVSSCRDILLLLMGGVTYECLYERASHDILCMYCVTESSSNPMEVIILGLRCPSSVKQLASGHVAEYRAGMRTQVHVTPSSSPFFASWSLV